MSQLDSKDDEEAFANLINMILTVSKGDDLSIKGIASRMGMSEANLRARIRNDHKRTKFTLGQVRDLIRAVDDERIPSFFVENTQFIVARRVTSPTGGKSEAGNIPTKNEILRQGADEAILETSEVLRSVLNALSDNKICHKDKKEIIKEIEDAERALVALKVQI